MRRTIRSYVLLVVLLFLGLILSLLLGRYALSFEKILDKSSMDRRIFLQLRLGRSLMVLLTGICLGISGSVFQTVLRNPLAAPDVTGVASGASTGAAIAILLTGRVGMVTSLSAFLGGVLAVSIALLLTFLSRRRDTATLLLAGIVTNALFQAVLMLLKLSADTERTLASIEFWLMGSFADMTTDRFLQTLPYALSGLLGLFLIHRPVQMLHLADDEAKMLGVNVPLIRALALLFATLSTSAVISRTGLISFVGLLAPHAARILCRGERSSMALSAIAGGVLLLYADLLARMVGPSEIPVSIITSLIGAPVLFLLFAGKGGESHA